MATYCGTLISTGNYKYKLNGRLFNINAGPCQIHSHEGDTLRLWPKIKRSPRWPSRLAAPTLVLPRFLFLASFSAGSEQFSWKTSSSEQPSFQPP